MDILHSITQTFFAQHDGRNSDNNQELSQKIAQRFIEGKEVGDLISKSDLNRWQISDVLKEAIQQFWVKEYKHTDNSQINLANLSLVGVSLEGLHLENANLSGCDLTEANLNKCNLEEANLSSANLTRARLIGSQLDNATLNNVNLEEANLFAADLRKTNLDAAKGVSAKYEDAFRMQSLRQQLGSNSLH